MMFGPGIYLVADYGLVPDADRLLSVLEAAVRGGVVAVQIRHKAAEREAMLDLCLRARVLTSPHNVPLIVNDWVDVAAEIGAEGAHVGQSDLPLVEARRMLGPSAILGLSLEETGQFGQALQAGVDYVAASPVFSTPTKTDTSPELGLEGLARLSAESPVPVVAIGGIHLGNVEAIARHGAYAAAVVSAICMADDPEAAARELGRAFAMGRD